MEFDHVEKKDISIFKKLERFVSSNVARPKSSTRRTFMKSKSWPSKEKVKVAPNGCFSVYVGEEKKRFVIKIKFANHPLFKMLLEDAELEYGFNSEGPLLLPCEVDLFCKLLSEMDCVQEFDDEYLPRGSCTPCTPIRRFGSSNYGLLTPTRSLKINHF
ncbi:hypothetical protein ACS0TY_030407 [Phlomoides rotata]